MELATGAADEAAVLGSFTRAESVAVETATPAERFGHSLDSQRPDPGESYSRSVSVEDHRRRNNIHTSSVAGATSSQSGGGGPPLLGAGGQGEPMQVAAIKNEDDGQGQTTLAIPSSREVPGGGHRSSKRAASVRSPPSGSTPGRSCR